MIKCDVCGAERAAVNWKPRPTPILLVTEPSRVELIINPTVPVISCEKCGETFIDDRGEDIINEAVKSVQEAFKYGGIQASLNNVPDWS